MILVILVLVFAVILVVFSCMKVAKDADERLNEGQENPVYYESATKDMVPKSKRRPTDEVI